GAVRRQGLIAGWLVRRSTPGSGRSGIGVLVEGAIGTHGGSSHFSGSRSGCRRASILTVSNDRYAGGESALWIGHSRRSGFRSMAHIGAAFKPAQAPLEDAGAMIVRQIVFLAVERRLVNFWYRLLHLFQPLLCIVRPLAQRI